MLQKTIMLTIVILLYSCSGEPKCDEGYIEHFGVDGTSWCVPEFEEGALHNFNLGDTYYHKDFGVINYKNGIWLTTHNQIIKP
ncbi:hypothetical protein [uncultured Maribacter sp.]|uniref:hypothetical protein n=1 Tax=uncultured Maribacter sp. TaxID=431308 RepID=UPI00260C3023|nr:hypothetical protein [uncultured Maribacter sp.]